MELKTIPGHRQYAVSRCGKVFRIAGGRRKAPYELKQNFRDGCYVTLLTENKVINGQVVDFPCYKSVAVHRLVALAWLPAPQDTRKLWVSHKDGNKQNNHADNLEWTSISENIKHAFASGLRKVPTGAEHWCYGRKATEQQRLAMSIAKKGKRHPQYKGFYVIDGRKFYSANEAASATGLCARSILRWCKAGKLGFSFVPDPERKY